MGSLIVPLAVEYHEGLHAEISHVPVLENSVAKRVVREFEPNDYNYLENIAELLLTINDVIRGRRFDDMARQSAHLTMASIERQIPFIKEGYYEIN